MADSDNKINTITLKSDALNGLADIPEPEYCGIYVDENNDETKENKKDKE